MFNNIVPANFGTVDSGVLLVSVAVFYLLTRRLGRRRTTPLKGPASSNFFFGMLPLLLEAPDSGAIYEEWANEYGSVFAVPSILGSKKVVLTDPKAIIHFYNKETYGYVATPHARRFLQRLVGRGVLFAEGDSHKRQRRALNPAFSNASIKSLTPIFYNSAYSAKAAWDAFIIESGSSDGIIIDVQKWMSNVSLDTIGLAGFNHNFDALSGRPSDIASVFDAMGSKPSLMDTAVAILSMILPVFDRIPTGRRGRLDDVAKMMKGLADQFLAQTSAEDKSVVGLLAKSAQAEKMTQEEVVSQINVLLLAGYETTAISLTWAFIELARNSNIQSKLREELLRVGGDPTWEELTSNLPFLDAFTCEVLRMYPPLTAQDRLAAEDDILPLSALIETASGELVDSIFVSKGTMITLPMQCMNRSLVFWGPDAKVFNPTRWIDESAAPAHHRAQEIQGYHHLLTFADGPRMCLGKGFALTEFKAVLSVLVRNFTFEFPNGPETKLGLHTNLLPRPKVEGEEGSRVPLLIRAYASE
ncbi:cytochrome P450 [Mycena vulgaris]|nr:cytochrome P450 [Mycena vulgaris]